MFVYVRMLWMGQTKANYSSLKSVDPVPLNCALNACLCPQGSLLPKRIDSIAVINHEAGAFQDAVH